MALPQTDQQSDLEKNNLTLSKEGGEVLPDNNTDIINKHEDKIDNYINQNIGQVDTGSVNQDSINNTEELVKGESINATTKDNPELKETEEDDGINKKLISEIKSDSSLNYKSADKNSDADKKTKVSFMDRIKSVFKKKSKNKSIEDKNKHEEHIDNAIKNSTKKDANLNHKTSKEEDSQLRKIELDYHAGMSTIRDMIAPSSIEVSTKMIKIGSTYSRSFFVYSYPRFIEANWLGEVINKDIGIDISFFIYPSQSDMVLKLLRRKVTQMRSTILMNTEKGKTSNPALEIALQDAEVLREQLIKGEEKFFHLCVYFNIYAQSEDGLDKISSELETILNGRMVLTKRANLQHNYGLTSCIPMCLDNLDVPKNMSTSPLSTIFPCS